MSKPIAIDGDYVDLKFIKGRKVAQIHIEIPIEAASKFVEVFGTPLPDRTIPVAIARLVQNTGLKEQLRESIEHEKSKRHWNELSRAQQAGIAANEQRFRTFLNEEYHYQCETEKHAAEAIRELCGAHLIDGLTTRRHLDSDDQAGKLWDNLYSKFQVWFRVAA